MFKQKMRACLIATGLLGVTTLAHAQDCLFNDNFNDSDPDPAWEISEIESSRLRLRERNNRVEFWAPNASQGFDYVARFNSNLWYIDMRTDWAISSQFRINPPNPTYGEMAFGFLLMYQAGTVPGTVNDAFAFSAGTYNYGKGIVDYEATRYWRDGVGEVLTVDPRGYTNAEIFIWYDAAQDSISYGEKLGEATQTIYAISSISTLQYAQIGFFGYSIGFTPATTGNQMRADDLCILYGNLLGPSVGACCDQADCVQTLASACPEEGWRGEGTTCEGPAPCQNEPLLVPDDYPTIEAAIAAAEEGDEIIVAPGVHLGTGAAVVDPIGKALLIRSSEGPEVTFLDGESARHVVLCESGESSETIIQGFTIMNGSAQERGGGIRIQFESHPKFENCIIRDCSAEKGGGCSIENSNPVFLDCSFLENESIAEGAAIDASGASNCVLENCSVLLNVAGSDLTYAAINIRDTSVATLSGTLVCDNVPNELIGEWVDEGDNKICDGCDADLNGDNLIDGSDLTFVLGFWGPCIDPENCIGDLTGDGFIDGADLTTVLAFWGACQ